MATVTIQGVIKTYPGNTRAVDDLNLEIRDGELMVLVGPSGCGKTTTLRMIAGLEQATSGIIRIGNRVVNDVPPQDRHVAMVFQDLAIYPHLSVFDNLAFGLRQRGCPRQEIQLRVIEVARTLAIDELLKRRPSELSGGQQQRVALGRAIIRRADVCLFDEPLSNLDTNLRNQLRHEIKRIRVTHNQTMVYVTHDQTEAMTMGDRIVVMHEGVVQQIGEPRLLYDKPANTFVATFIGAPPMNLIPGALRRANDQLFFEADTIRIQLPWKWKRDAASHIDRPVFFGVRPEDLVTTGASDQAASDAPTITATMESIEETGPDTYFHLRAGTTLLTSRQTRNGSFEAVTDFASGQEICLSVRVARSHLFDAETGMAFDPTNRANQAASGDADHIDRDGLIRDR